MTANQLAALISLPGVNTYSTLLYSGRWEYPALVIDHDEIGLEPGLQSLQLGGKDSFTLYLIDAVTSGDADHDELEYLEAARTGIRGLLPGLLEELNHCGLGVEPNGNAVVQEMSISDRPVTCIKLGVKIYAQ